MAKFLQIVNGVARSVEAFPAIEEARLTVVASSPGANEIVPTVSGTPITIPDSIEYTDKELNIFFDGQKLYPILDYNYEGTAPRTQVSFTFDLLAGDKLFFEKEREA
jgi:hypothetical protein